MNFVLQTCITDMRQGGLLCVVTVRCTVCLFYKVQLDKIVMMKVPPGIQNGGNICFAIYIVVCCSVCSISNSSDKSCLMVSLSCV